MSSLRNNRNYRNYAPSKTTPWTQHLLSTPPTPCKKKVPTHKSGWVPHDLADIRKIFFCIKIHLQHDWIFVSSARSLWVCFGPHLALPARLIGNQWSHGFPVERILASNCQNQRVNPCTSSLYYPSLSSLTSLHNPTHFFLHFPQVGAPPKEVYCTLCLGNRQWRSFNCGTPDSAAVMLDGSLLQTTQLVFRMESMAVTSTLAEAHGSPPTAWKPPGPDLGRHAMSFDPGRQGIWGRTGPLRLHQRRHQLLKRTDPFGVADVQVKVQRIFHGLPLQFQWLGHNIVCSVCRSSRVSVKWSGHWFVCVCWGILCRGVSHSMKIRSAAFIHKSKHTAYHIPIS